MSEDVLSIVDPEKEVVIHQGKKKTVTISKGRYVHYISSYDKDGKMLDTTAYTSFDKEKLCKDVKKDQSKK